MKIWNKWNQLSIGKKIYSILWAFTGGLIITLIIMFVSLNSTYGLKNPPKDGWTVVAAEAKPGMNFPSEDQIKVKTKIEIEDGIFDEFNHRVVPAGTPAGTEFYFSAARKVEAFNEYFVFVTIKVGEEDVTPYKLGLWDATATPKAKTAINATATIGAIFGVALVSTIFTTVIVSVKEKKTKGGSK